MITKDDIDEKTLRPTISGGAKRGLISYFVLVSFKGMARGLQAKHTNYKIIVNKKKLEHDLFYQKHHDLG